MPKLQLRRFEEILQRMINRVVARTDLSDLTDSSAVKHVLAAVAREMDDTHFQITRLTDLFSIDRATGADLDERAADIQPAVVRRQGARRAVGTVVFSRAVAAATTVVIPTGTIVRTANGTSFRTTAQAQITVASPEVVSGHGVGRDSNLVSATAVEPGSIGNVAPNTIRKFASKPAGVDEVTNVTAFTTGRDQESDDEFRDRLKQFIASLSRSTVDSLESIVLGVEDPTPLSDKIVVFSHVFEDPIDRGNVIVYVDDGAGTASTTANVVGENVTFGLAGTPADTAIGGEEFLDLNNRPIDLSQVVTITSVSIGFGGGRGVLISGQDYFLNPASGRIFFDPPLVFGEKITASYTHFTGLIREVQKVIDGDPADRANYPGYRAGGVLVRVLPPVVRQLNVSAVLTVVEGFDRPTVIANAEAAVSRYINGLGISGDVIRNEIIEQIMGVAGVVDLTLTVPATNTAILDNEIPRIISGDINIQ